MTGFLLISPTGSGKSWVCKNDPYFIDHAVDGDSLIDWQFNWNDVDWRLQDRMHLDKVLQYMRKEGRCVCWYVGTTAIADALTDDRLHRIELGIVLLPEQSHRGQVERRNKRDHGWTRASEHRTLCEQLIHTYKIPQFESFQDAGEYIRLRTVNE
jgi:hypothetical protein